MKLGLCRYCSDYAELDYGLCARCLDFELDRKRPETTPQPPAEFGTQFLRKEQRSAANNPALLRCPRCTLIIRKEGECPYCESEKRPLELKREMLNVLRARHLNRCPEMPFHSCSSPDNCETCPEAAVIRQMKADLNANS